MQDDPTIDGKLDEYHLRIETCFRKHSDATEVLDFSVMVNAYGEDQELPTANVGHLKGFIVQEGYLPHDDDDGSLFDVFDMRSHHAMTAYHILKESVDSIFEALQSEADVEELSSVAMIERIWLHPEMRGQKVALRLLREAQHVLSRAGLLVLMKAYPDGERGKISHRSLADYYMLDETLSLRPVDTRKHPGWLVAAWEFSDPPSEDESFLLGVSPPLRAETDPQD